jgi:histidine triad (HIT) family protein
MADCIFCAIVAGDAPAAVVHDDERTVAFMDIAPLTRGHSLVVPKRHADDILVADPEDVAAVARSAQRVARAAKEAFGADGINLLQTNGRVAMQTVFHLHVHVLPRYVGDGFHVELNRVVVDPDDLRKQAGALAAALA